MEGPGLVYSGRVSGSNWYCNIRIHDYVDDDADDEVDKNDDTDDNEDDLPGMQGGEGIWDQGKLSLIKKIDLFISKFLV